jgi:hypothetical protein
MLHSFCTWEYIQADSRMPRLACQPGLRYYRCIEVTENPNIYHVRFSSGEDGSTSFSHLMMFDIEDVIRMLAAHHEKNEVVFVQTKWKEVYESFDFFEISEIYKGIDENGQPAYSLVGLEESRASTGNQIMGS